jgi:hypothetical protein
MAVTFRTRTVPSNQVIFDQADILSADQYTRIPGVSASNVTLTLFRNNTVVPWPLVEGASVSDGQVVAGFVYWTALPNQGYGIRFFPNSLGHWNLIIDYPGTSQLISLDYDVVLPLAVESGVTAGFCT